MRYLIVAAGETKGGLAVNLFKNGGFEVIMAVDGGMEFMYRNHICPDILVGDFDSVNRDTLEYFRRREEIDICKLEPEKDLTDTEFAVREAIRRGARHITVIGATGGRLDHALANIAVLGIGLEAGVEMCILDECNRIRLINAAITLPKAGQYGRYVSLLPYCGDVTGVTLKGMKYPLDNFTMKAFHTIGVSNEIVDDKAEISLSSGCLLVVESKDFSGGECL